MNTILVVGGGERLRVGLAPLLKSDSRVVAFPSDVEAMDYLRASPAPVMLFADFSAWPENHLSELQRDFPHVACVNLNSDRDTGCAAPEIAPGGSGAPNAAWPSPDSAPRRANGRLAAYVTRSAPTGTEPPESMNSALDLLLILGHDLRAAIAIIGGYSSMLRDGAHGAVADGVAVFQRITNTCGRLIGTVDAIVRIAQAGEPGSRLETAPVTPLELMSAAIEDLAGAAEMQRHALHCEPSGGNEASAVDRHLVMLVLRNLVHNAIKFTPAGGAIVLKGRSDPEGLTIEVHDSGPGIPTEVQETLFARGKPALSAGAAGSGIGLWSAKRLVQLHGGTIWVRSAPGEGSIFGFFVRSGDQPNSVQESAGARAAG